LSQFHHHEQIEVSDHKNSLLAGLHGYSSDTTVVLK